MTAPLGSHKRHGANYGALAAAAPHGRIPVPRQDVTHEARFGPGCERPFGWRPLFTHFTLSARA